MPSAVRHLVSGFIPMLLFCVHLLVFTGYIHSGDGGLSYYLITETGAVGIGGGRKCSGMFLFCANRAVYVFHQAGLVGVDFAYGVLRGKEISRGRFRGLLCYVSDCDELRLG